MAVPKRKRSSSIVRIRKHHNQTTKTSDTTTHTITFCVYCNQWTEYLVCKKASCMNRRDQNVLDISS